jgi:hypothetical protein
LIENGKSAIVPRLGSHRSGFLISGRLNDLKVISRYQNWPFKEKAPKKYSDPIEPVEAGLNTARKRYCTGSEAHNWKNM